MPFGAPDATGMRSWIVLVIIVALGLSALQDRAVAEHPPVLVLTVVTLLLWLAWTVLRPGRIRSVLVVACAAASSVGAGLGVPQLIAGLVAGAVLLIGDPRQRLAPIVALTGGGCGLLLVVGALARITTTSLLLDLAVLAFGVLIGVSRRARVKAAEQQEALREAAREASRAAEQDAARNRLLEDRAAVARDLHDVLAHSLGGLVLQLDAIEALLERGRLDEAAVRAGAARTLAAEGLADARRAVAALRDPALDTGPTVSDEALEDLLTAHRSLGGPVEVTGDPALAGVDQPHRQVLVRALQEALTNARRHAPSSPVHVAVERDPHLLVLRVENPAPSTPSPSPGGGHGLTGMTERFASLGDGSAVSAGRRGDRFVVEARAVLA
ncbi:signal transduction histidine kinase [Amnibacterium kyonggiense]|uniref:histidine kinase n=1 Tax=Amnibacterium kyonggiense TaxID=595671 RepID=A0A4R7FSC7_9MICO|nr:signal transduction histidine kinase [Amnibacterium kyonggiense]